MKANVVFELCNLLKRYSRNVLSTAIKIRHAVPTQKREKVDLKQQEGHNLDCTVEPRFNEPLYNKVVGITNDILQPGQSYNKMNQMNGTEPRYNEPRSETKSSL